ncbi:kinase phosphorylation domain-containing protein, partial [Lipomyces arxii]|uniref:kinase phosphorylation domain-containing protein n=1 Tax=Lipomyces arxii TaxID=56418 RepID=UPI0034CDED2D
MDLLSGVGNRPGVRGGRAAFSWEAVKQDKYRENFLGHSVMAPTGRWAQKNDALWYARDPKEESDIRREEKRKLKQAEEDAIADAL